MANTIDENNKTFGSDDIKIEEDTTEQSGVQLFNVIGTIDTVSVIPVERPTNIKDQLKIYISGATKRLYIHDKINVLWYYITLT